MIGKKKTTLSLFAPCQLAKHKPPKNLNHIKMLLTLVEPTLKASQQEVRLLRHEFSSPSLPKKEANTYILMQKLYLISLTMSSLRGFILS